MLIELAIRDFAIIDELRIAFGPGLNVLTGETGAGKSIVIDALGAVLGERVGPDVVRSGAKAASVEAIFDVNSFRDGSELLRFADEFGIDLEEGFLVLRREIAASGRTTARINGRATTASALTRAGAVLVDIHGQSDHLSLLRQTGHLEMLDRFAGTIHERARVAGIVQQLRSVRAVLDNLMTGERERQRRIDLLGFQVSEISEAALQSGEEERLTSEREVLVNAERLAEEALLAHALLAGESDDGDGASPVLDALRRATAQVDAIAMIDATMLPTAERLREIGYQLDDVSTEMRDYRERIDADPARLEAINERIDVIRKLKRKYGASIEDINRYGDDANAELAQLTGGEFDSAQLQEREAQLLQALAEVAGDLSRRRREAAFVLERGVETSISELNMGRARFAVAIEHRVSERGVELPNEGRVAFDETGVDSVEFLLAANAGETLKPLVRVASGGEMARLMLALKSILAVADETSTLVFDEVDAGVGGRSGQVVGEKLWGLTRGHQVIVITHLPQIAAFADAHFRINKQTRDDHTSSTITEIAGEERIEEIAVMLDGQPVTPASRESARQMVDRVNRWKANAGAAA